jgi:hypothetical protein
MFFVELFLFVLNDFDISLLSCDADKGLHKMLNIAVGVSDVNFMQEIDYLTDVERLAQLIYQKYFFAFLISSLILLVAMIGAIVLTLRKDEVLYQQDISDQVYRKIKINHIS